MSKKFKEQWRKVRLSEITKINEQSVEKNFSHTEIDYIDISSVGSGILFETKKYQLSKAPSRAKRLVKNGDTVLSTVRPNRRSFLYIKNPKENYVVSTGFVVLSPKEEIDTRFLYYLVTNQRFTDYLTANVKGSAYPAVDTGIISRAEVEVPTLFTQKKIASILSAYDNLIELNERRIKILEEIARLIYKEWFVKFKFPVHEKVKMVKSELGRIPEGWGVESILDVEGVELIKAKVKRYNGVKEYFATANIEGITIIKNGEMVTFDGKPSRAQMQPEENTIWFAKMRETFKVLCFTSVNKEITEKSILSSGFAGFKVDKDKIGFFYFTICSERFHALKDQYCTGATQMSSTIEGLSLIKIILPEGNLIKKYNNISLPVINQIILLQQQNKNLRQTRDMLLPKVISGEVKIRL